MNLSSRSTEYLDYTTFSSHDIGGHLFSFGHGKLADRPSARAAFLRIAADLIEDGHQLDLLGSFEETVFYLEDLDNRVSALILMGHYEENLVVRFAWTHPGMRRLGLFRNLMKHVTQCFFDNPQFQRLRMSPPTTNKEFDAAVENFGFVPISLVTEYRPF
jgi:hypothetical protein